MTKCPSVAGMTALGLDLPNTSLWKTQICKYKRTQILNDKMPFRAWSDSPWLDLVIHFSDKHKNAQTQNDKMSFRAWYDSPWSLPAFAFLSSSRPSHSRAAGRPKTRKDFQRFNRSRTINSFLTEPSWYKQLSNRINVISTVLQLKDHYQSTKEVKEKEPQTISNQDSSIITA